MKKMITNVSFVFSLLSFFIFGGCSDSPSSSEDTLSMSGTVQLEEKTDHSGVTIGLYRLIELDTAIVRLNQQYPNIGVQISQQTEFDHREHEPVARTTSNASGSWKIDGIQSGQYHVVAEKDSFGWKYLYNKEPDNSINIGTLNEVVYLKYVLSQNTTINQRQVVAEDLIIPDGIKLTLTGGSILLIPNNSDVEVLGILELNGNSNNPVFITSELSKKWRKIDIKSSAKFIAEYCVFNNTENGIINQSTDFTFNNNILRVSDLGIVNFNVKETLLLSNNNFINNQIGLESENGSGLRMEGNLFFNNKEAIRLISSTNNLITQNIFYEDSIALTANPPGGFGYSRTNGNIRYSQFEKNSIGIIIGGNVILSGMDNNFINHKNMFIKAPLGSRSSIDTLDFSGNYWGMFQENQIKNMISDADDKNPKWGTYINVNPFETAAVDIKNKN